MFSASLCLCGLLLCSVVEARGNCAPRRLGGAENCNGFFVGLLQFNLKNQVRTDVIWRNTEVFSVSLCLCGLLLFSREAGCHCSMTQAQILLLQIL